MAASGGNAASTLLGTRLRVSYLDAVQAMATAAHCGELDDIHGGAATCIGGMIIPALLAMAEKYGGSGRRFLEATVAGYETIARVGLSIDAPKLFARGWWPSTVCGAFGVAAAGAKFLAWPVDKTANALGIAALHSGGMLTGGMKAPRRVISLSAAPRKMACSRCSPRSKDYRAEARVGRSARFLFHAVRRTEVGIFAKLR